MGLSRRARDVGVAMAILALTALIVARVDDGGGEALTGAARAADGDTLTLDGQRIRLLGMDTPELAQVCKRDGADWRCGVAARSRLAELLRAGPIICRMQGTDRYDRRLARCENAAGDLGARMVREGLAVAYGGYEDEEQFARAERKGLWGAEFDMPQQWRRTNGRPQEEAHDAEPGFLGGILDRFGF